LPRATLSKPTVKAVSSAPPAVFPRNLYIGTSGWAYPTWKPGFYPKGTSSRKFLAYYASQLSSVEVNYTFRTLPSAAQLDTWLSDTPDGFRFTFKAPQRITHFQRLLNSEDTAAEFLASLAPVRTAGKLGPLLFQLPPNFAADNTRLSAFLSMRAFKKNQDCIAFEFRHPSWFSEDTYTVLRRHNAALCIAESDDLITPEVSTADFHCYRLRCNGGYKPAQLKKFAVRFTELAATAEVFAYLKHEDEPTGALNATALLRLLRKTGAR
jgi:uncharacterized protein YecE (DUF72 family)